MPDEGSTRHERLSLRRRREWRPDEKGGARARREVAGGHGLFAGANARRAAFPLIETSAEVMLAAADLATDHQLSIWDSVVLSAAAESGCRLLLTEDMQEGFTWKGVTVTNPFATSKHELLAALLDAEPES